MTGWPSLGHVPALDLEVGTCEVIFTWTTWKDSKWCVVPKNHLVLRVGEGQWVSENNTFPQPKPKSTMFVSLTPIRQGYVANTSPPSNFNPVVLTFDYFNDALALSS